MSSALLGHAAAARPRRWRRSCRASNARPRRSPSTFPGARQKTPCRPFTRSSLRPPTSSLAGIRSVAVASLAAAEPDAPYAALVLFSYPLHPPGRPTNRPTDRSLAIDSLPVLLLSGNESIRPDRPPSGGSAAASGCPACDVSAARTRGPAALEDALDRRRRVSGRHRRDLTKRRRQSSATRCESRFCTKTATPKCAATVRTGWYPHAVPGPPIPRSRCPPMSPSEAQVPRVRSCARAPIAIGPTFGALTALFLAGRRRIASCARPPEGGLRRGPGQDDLVVRNPTRRPPSRPIPPGLAQFMTAIGRVESGGRYTARNARTGAYGKYQIIPSSWRGWARLYLHNANARKHAKPGKGRGREVSSGIPLARRIVDVLLVTGSEPEVRLVQICDVVRQQGHALLRAGPRSASSSRKPAAPTPTPSPTADRHQVRRRA